MQTLGLASEQKPSDGMLKRLFWPTIENQYDVDANGVQGFWLCCVVGVMSMIFAVATGSVLLGLFICATYVFGGMGVRERSIAAAVLVFTLYLLDRVLSIESAVLGLGGTGNPFLGIVAAMLLLSNVRGTILARGWRVEGTDPELAEEVERPTETWAEKVANKLPAAVWPKGRFVFYPLAGILLCVSGLSMVGLPFLAKQKAAQLQRQRQEQIEVTLPASH